MGIFKKLRRKIASWLLVTDSESEDIDSNAKTNPYINMCSSGNFYVHTKCGRKKILRVPVLAQLIDSPNEVDDALISRECPLDWVTGLAMSHARTLVIAYRHRDLFLQDEACPPMSESESADRFAFEKAWERLVNFTGRTTDGKIKPDVVDVDMEALVILEKRMFDTSEDAGIAGNHQWGLDIGMHQDNWYPWNSHGPEEEKDTREGNESELEVGPEYNKEELAKWHRTELEKEEAREQMQRRTRPRPTLLRKGTRKRRAASKIPAESVELRPTDDSEEYQPPAKRTRRKLRDVPNANVTVVKTLKDQKSIGSSLVAPDGDAILSLSSAGLSHRLSSLRVDRINWIHYQRRTGRQYRHKDCKIMESDILRSRLVYMPMMQAGTPFIWNYALNQVLELNGWSLKAFPVKESSGRIDVPLIITHYSSQTTSIIGRCVGVPQLRVPQVSVNPAQQDMRLSILRRARVGWQGVGKETDAPDWDRIKSCDLVALQGIGSTHGYAMGRSETTGFSRHSAPGTSIEDLPARSDVQVFNFSLEVRKEKCCSAMYYARPCPDVCVGKPHVETALVRGYEECQDDVLVGGIKMLKEIVLMRRSHVNQTRPPKSNVHGDPVSYIETMKNNCLTREHLELLQGLRKGLPCKDCAIFLHSLPVYIIPLFYPEIMSLPYHGENGNTRMDGRRQFLHLSFTGGETLITKTKPLEDFVKLINVLTFWPDWYDNVVKRLRGRLAMVRDEVYLYAQVAMILRLSGRLSGRLRISFRWDIRCDH
ncbi:hypothetical protein EDD85DRAFT_785168 [Armillaria nabsnona]|nr:hypothetical protein EDD85DRAFT_785168 [Armillaria nabsnona]